MEFRRQFLDYIHIYVMLVRIVVTFIMIHLVNTGAEGFEHVDLKEFSQAISLISLPYMVLFFSNWTIQYGCDGTTDAYH